MSVRKSVWMVRVKLISARNRAISSCASHPNVSLNISISSYCLCVLWSKAQIKYCSARLSKPKRDKKSITCGRVARVVQWFGELIGEGVIWVMNCCSCDSLEELFDKGRLSSGISGKC
jgi:hypothetical protein